MAAIAYIRIPEDKLVAIAIAMAAQGYIRQSGERQMIVAKAHEMFPRTDGKAWKFPKAWEVRSIFVPAYDAAEKPEVAPEKPAKASRKASGKAPAKGAPNHSEDCNCIFCERIRAKAGNAPAKAPAKSGKGAPKAPKASDSGKLTKEEKALLLSLMQKALAS